MNANGCECRENAMNRVFAKGFVKTTRTARHWKIHLRREDEERREREISRLFDDQMQVCDSCVLPNVIICKSEDRWIESSGFTWRPQMDHKVQLVLQCFTMLAGCCIIMQSS